MSAELSIPFEWAVLGGKTSFSLDKEEACPRCSGTGRKAGSRKCSECGGSGRTRTRKIYRVQIPAGIEDSEKIRLRGQGGQSSRGNRAGDLIIMVRVEPHRFF